MIYVAGKIMFRILSCKGELLPVHEFYNDIITWFSLLFYSTVIKVLFLLNLKVRIRDARK